MLADVGARVAVLGTGIMDAPMASFAPGTRSVCGTADEVSFSVALAAKDAELIREAAAGESLELPLVDAVAAQLARAAELGHGEEDMAATFRASEPR